MKRRNGLLNRFAGRRKEFRSGFCDFSKKLTIFSRSIVPPAATLRALAVRHGRWRRALLLRRGDMTSLCQPACALSKTHRSGCSFGSLPDSFSRPARWD